MGFLKRLMSGGDRGPDWTGGMSGEEFRRFLELVGDDQRRRGHTFRIEDDGLFVDRPEAGEPLIFGLSNLAMLCRGIDPSDWPEVIATHFGNIESAMDEEGQYDDFETAMPYLKARVYGTADFSPELLASVPKRPLTPDLFATLVLDLPTSVRTVASETIATWPEPLDRLFEIGLDHLAAEVASYERETIDVEPGVRIDVLIGDSFFVASQGLRLPALTGDAAHVAVAMPNRHVLMWHPLREKGPGLASLKAMTVIAGNRYDEGPGSLSPHPHWWHHGALTPLPVERTRKGVNAFWPEEFMGFLDGLAGPAST